MRHGYRGYRGSVAWLGSHRRRDLSTALAGTLGDGRYPCLEVIELVNFPTYTEVTLENKDGLTYQEKIYGRDRWKYKLGKLYTAIIKTETKGFKIEADYNGFYHIVDVEDQQSIAKFKYINNAYKFCKENQIKLVRTRIVWSKGV